MLELEPVAYRASNEPIQILFKEVCGKVDADQNAQLEMYSRAKVENGGCDLQEAHVNAAE